MDFKDKVKFIRQRLNLSQKELALQLGLDYCTINKWENGACAPQIKKEQIFYRFCKEHGVDFVKSSEVTDKLKILISKLEELDALKQTLEKQIESILNEIKQLVNDEKL